MRRRLVLWTIGVVVVVLVVLLSPVVLIVNDANDGDTPAGQFLRLAVIAVFALIAAAVLAAVQARQLAHPLERLARSAALLYLELPFTPEGLREEVERAVARAGNEESYARIIVTRGGSSE